MVCLFQDPLLVLEKYIGKILESFMNILNKGKRTLEAAIIVLDKGRQSFLEPFRPSRLGKSRLRRHPQFSNLVEVLALLAFGFPSSVLGFLFSPFISYIGVV